MVITVETGEGVAGANSYISVADAVTFLQSRGVTAAITEPLLLNAVDAIESQCPALSLGTFYTTVTTIPAKIGHAQAWVANYILDGVDPGKYVVNSGSLKRKKIGPLEQEFFEGDKPGAVTVADMPRAIGLINEYCNAVKSSSDVATFPIIR